MSKRVDLIFLERFGHVERLKEEQLASRVYELEGIKNAGPARFMELRDEKK